MTDRIIRKENYVEAYTKYGPVLLRFVGHFTGDETTAIRIVDEAVWESLAREAVPSTYLRPFSRMLQIARQITLNFMKRDPLFNAWLPFENEPDFFPLTDKALTEMHKQIFLFRYYRGIEEVALAERFTTSRADIRQKMRETLLSIHKEIDAGILITGPKVS